MILVVVRQEAGLRQQWLKKAKKTKGDHQTRAHLDRMVLMVVYIGREAGLHERWPKYTQGKADKQH